MKAKSISLWIVTGMFSAFLFGPIAGVALTVAARFVGLWLLQGHTLKGALLAVAYYDPCTDTTSTHTRPGECVTEGTGIIGVLLIKRGFNISSAITDDATYATAKTAKDIEVVAELEGYWPETTQVTVPGLAGRMERHSYITYDMPFKHEGVFANLKFWNTRNQRKNYGIAFITEDYKAVAPLDQNLEPILVSIFAKPVGEQEFGKILTFQGNVKWKCKDLVYYLDNLTPAMLKPDFQV